MTDLFQHQVYKPSGGDALVKSGHYYVYYSSANDYLTAAVDTYLVEITWHMLVSWVNSTNATQIYPFTFTTGLTITKGINVNQGFSLGSTYNEASLTINHMTKVFKPTETTAPKTIAINLNIPSQSLIVVYQRKYKFRDSMFFVHQSPANGHFNVARLGGQPKVPFRKGCQVEIMSEEYGTLQAGLSGTGTIYVNTVGHAQGVKRTRKKANCTPTCINKLGQMGI